jgi:hypothetical protein
VAEIVESLNRLAGTSGLEAAGAANVWAGTEGLEVVGALNVKAGVVGLELNGVCQLLAFLLGGEPGLDAAGALSSIVDVDPLLAEAVWRVDARRNGGGAQMRDLTGGAGSTPPEPNPKILTSTSFAGSALIGRMALTGGTATGVWMSDVDVRWRCAVLPHHDNDDLTHWAETFNIPNAGDGGVTDWGESAMLLRDDGGIGAGYDWDSSVSTPNQWDPEADVDLGQWADGLAVEDYRLTIVAATGVVTLYANDVEVFTETLGVVAFDEPPNASAVLVGPASTGLLALYTVDVLDGIDGDPLYTFDAADTTGWAAHTTGGAVTGAPSRLTWVGTLNAAHAFASDARFDIGAEDSATFAWRGRLIGPAFVRFGRNVGSAPGWAFIHAPGFSLPNSFVLNDGSNAVSATFGSLTTDDVVHVAVLDRAADELRVYVDGVQVGAAVDASALGAVSPSATVLVGGDNCYTEAAIIYDRALDDAEVAALGAVL